jgi:hypothetical protein
MGSSAQRAHKSTNGPRKATDGSMLRCVPSPDSSDACMSAPSSTPDERRDVWVYACPREAGPECKTGELRGRAGAVKRTCQRRTNARKNLPATYKRPKELSLPCAPPLTPCGPLGPHRHPTRTPPPVEPQQRYTWPHNPPLRPSLNPPTIGHFQVSTPSPSPRLCSLLCSCWAKDLR